ncbi:phenylalanine 4-monooxygenase [Inquilinus sp. CAU 1745]|uniref:phenylalanine 4-monooxygenase n=1 Tax=Inquilinus sp. CAU 1745 TaxID=3140369 RepID=UPI00325BEA6B
MAQSQRHMPGRAPEPRADFTIDQDWEAYSAEEHGVWRTLYHRQADLLKDRATPEFVHGLDGLAIAADGVPDFRRLNEALGRATGWRIVAVSGLVPDAIFFDHLANRRFPATCFICKPEEMDYLEEPDVFHDVFGHVPLLMNPIFADYMQAYGQGGLKALKQDSLHHLARLYWYTVEFGLIRNGDGLRIYGAGILSSKGESVYSMDDPKPNRIGFDLMRVMRTDYRIDSFQETYFVIDSFEELFEATAPDFTPFYARLKEMADLEPATVLPSDRLLHKGYDA